MDAECHNQNQLRESVKTPDMNILMGQNVWKRFCIIPVCTLWHQNHRPEKAVGERGANPAGLPNGDLTLYFMCNEPAFYKIILHRQRGLKLPAASDIRNCKKQETDKCANSPNDCPYGNGASRFIDTGCTWEHRHSLGRSDRDKVCNGGLLYRLHSGCPMAYDRIKAKHGR